MEVYPKCFGERKLELVTPSFQYHNKKWKHWEADLKWRLGSTFSTQVFVDVRRHVVFSRQAGLSDTAVQLQPAAHHAPWTARCCRARSTQCWTGFHTLCCSSCCWPQFQAEHQALQIFGLSQYGCFAVLMVMNPGPFNGCPTLSHRRTHLLVTVPKMRGSESAAQMLFCIHHPKQSYSPSGLSRNAVAICFKFKSKTMWENAAEEHSKGNLNFSPAHKAKRKKYFFYKDQNYLNMNLLQELGL